jgi:hypothetical protein
VHYNFMSHVLTVLTLTSVTLNPFALNLIDRLNQNCCLLLCKPTSEKKTVGIRREVIFGHACIPDRCMLKSFPSSFCTRMLA